MKTKIYGASDDLVIMDGAISDEHGCYNHKKPINILASDNTKATIFYNGEWKINVLVEGEKFLAKENSVGEDDEHFLEDTKGCSSYSDVLILDEGIEWIKIGSEKYKV